MAEGGVEKATPTLKEHAAGEALKSITDTLAMAKREGLRAKDKPTVLMTEAQGIGNPEQVDLLQCIDLSTADVVEKSGKPFHDGFEQT